MQLRFQHVALKALGTVLPASEISSLEIESRLAPLYKRLGLSEGRLEGFTGIRTRRHFEKGVVPSDIGVLAAEDLFSRHPEARQNIQCVIHASVCRDFLEPATAAILHRKLRLPSSCLLFDLSNACLSWVNGLIVAAGLIESGQISSALVVSAEDARGVVDNTIRMLNENLALTRQTLKPSLASLTLGSGGVAALLVRSPMPLNDGARFLGGANVVATQFHSLCQGGGSGQNSSAGITMETDSETMLKEGVALAAQTWRKTKQALQWTPDSVDATFCHQVGSAHRRLTVEKLELNPEKDFCTYQELGNMGASSIGITLAQGAQAKKIKNKDKIALLGIGSGLVCGMLGIEWSESVI